MPVNRCKSPLIFALIGLVLIGCDDSSLFDLAGSHSHPSKYTGKKVPIGPASQYAEPGLYDRFVEDHHFLLVCRSASGGRMLVALSTRCPNDGATVQYDSTADLLRCGRCDSAWTTDGLRRGGSTAKHALPRLRIIIDRPNQSANHPKPATLALIVDPSRQYQRRAVRTVNGERVIQQEWSATDSMFMFNLDPRLRSVGDHVKAP